MSTTGIANANITGHQAAANLAGERRRAIVYHDPFSPRALEVCGRAILRADRLGVEHYGPAPAPLDEKRDMYQEAIEELLDAIYYLTRQVAKLEDLRERERESAPPGARSPRPGPAKRHENAVAVVES